MLGREYLESTRTKQSGILRRKPELEVRACSWRKDGKVFRLASRTLGVRHLMHGSSSIYQAAFQRVFLPGSIDLKILTWGIFLASITILILILSFLFAKGQSNSFIMLISKPFLISLGIARVYAATATTSAQTSSVTGCHTHGSSIYCIDGDGHEVLVSATSTTTGVPAQYTGCHSHGSES